MSFEMPLKIRENKYTNKEGIEVTAKEIKLADLGMDAHIVIAKVYVNPIEKISVKDGKQFKSYKTMVDYQGERINLTMNENTAEKWSKVITGNVKVTKIEIIGTDNKTRYTYTFENI